MIGYYAIFCHAARQMVYFGHNTWVNQLTSGRKQLCAYILFICNDMIISSCSFSCLWIANTNKRFNVELCNVQWCIFHFEAFSEAFHFSWVFCVLLGFVGIYLHLQCLNSAHVHCQELQSMALQLPDLEVIIGFKVYFFHC